MAGTRTRTRTRRADGTAATGRTGGGRGGEDQDVVHPARVEPLPLDDVRCVGVGTRQPSAVVVAALMMTRSGIGILTTIAATGDGRHLGQDGHVAPDGERFQAVLDCGCIDYGGGSWGSAAGLLAGMAALLLVMMRGEGAGGGWVRLLRLLVWAVRLRRRSGDAIGATTATAARGPQN